MTKITLSHAEVQVLISIITIIACTLALFLSGYAIQQRTLRDLRQAIKPRELHHAGSGANQFLEIQQQQQQKQRQQNRKPQVVLADGTVIHVDTEAEKLALEATMRHATPKEGIVEVEVKVTTHLDDTEPILREKDLEEKDAWKLSVVEDLQAQLARKTWAVEHPDPLVKSRVPISRAERRRLIRKEIKRLSQQEGLVYHQRKVM